MKINQKSEKMQKAKEAALKAVREADNKEEAIVQAIEIMNETFNEELILQLQQEAASRKDLESEKEFNERMGLRTLSSKEIDFYQKLINNPKQALEADQIDIFPTSTIDLTLEEIRTENPLLTHVEFSPVGVKKWLSAEKTGAFKWGDAMSTEQLTNELRATFRSITTDVNSLTVFMILPKAIRELSLPFVDKYCRAILKEQLNDGLEYGTLLGRGESENVHEPIGLFMSASSKNEDGTSKAKDVHEDLTEITPEGLAPVKTYLSKNGKRVIKQIVLVCNPSDRANYVDPATQDRRGNVIPIAKSFVIAESAQCPQGKAGFFLSKKFNLSMDNIKITDFNQTLADQNADLIVGRTYANGRAVDDNVCYVFDPTKLKPFVDKVQAEVTNTVNTKEVIEGA